jgi:hypothetical protein
LPPERVLQILGVERIIAVIGLERIIETVGWENVLDVLLARIPREQLRDMLNSRRQSVESWRSRCIGES